MTDTDDAEIKRLANKLFSDHMSDSEIQEMINSEEFRYGREAARGAFKNVKRAVREGQSNE